MKTPPSGIHIKATSGMALEDFFIVHLNNEYVRYGALEIKAVYSRICICGGERTATLY